MSKNRNWTEDGGNAFPDEDNSGMTLRDYFAAKAMHEIFVGGGWSEYETLVEQSYKIADAMLKERDK